MSEPAAARHERIMLWLRDQQTISIEEFASRLNVSGMTIHRDLNELARIGAVEKIHGGARLAGRPLSGIPVTACTVCGGHVQERAVFIVSQAEGAPQTACCAHCGMLIKGLENATSILAREFIYGRMVNARQARYVIGSSVTLCCHPGALCFATADDAERFQRGFGGSVMTFEAACQHITQLHGTCSGDHN